MSNLFWMCVLAALPISEARGAIIYGLTSGVPDIISVTLSVLINIAIVPALFWILNIAHFRTLAFKLFGKQVYAKIENHRKAFEKFDELALLIFVAIPAPFTGAWTAVLISEILGLRRTRASVVIAFGVLIAAAIVYASAKGLLAIWR